MKRIIAIVLVCMIVLSVGVLPASAETLYAYVNGSESLPVYLDASLTQRAGSAALPPYTVVQVYTYGDTYAAIVGGNVRGYVSIGRLTLLSTESNARIIAQKTRVYAAPNTSSASISVPKGMTIYEVQRSGDWAQIANGTYTAYIQTKYLTTAAQPSPTPSPSAVVPATVVVFGAKLYASANTSAASIDISVGSKVNVLKINGQWTYLEYNGVYAYCPIAYLCADDYLKKHPELLPTASPTPSSTAAPTATVAPSNVIPATVVVFGAKLYASANTSAASIDISVGSKVNVLKINGQWTYLEYNGVYAYCPIAYLCADDYLAKHPELLPTASPTVSPTVVPTPTVAPSNVIPATVVVFGAKLYASANASAASIDISVGSKVNVLKINGQWTYLEYNGVYAYCPIAYLCADDYLAKHPELLPTASPTPSPTNQTIIPAFVNASNAKVYESPSTSSRSLSVSYGLRVNVVAVSGEWARIERNGMYAYCKASILTPGDGAQPTVSPTANPFEGYIQETFGATVVASGARFYASASTNSDNVSAPLGTNVTVKAYNSSWAYVQLNGVYGYISVGVLSRDNYTPVRKGAVGSDVRNLESALLTLGYLDSVPGTSYSDYTAWCVQRFQKACGMSATGEADVATLRVLYGGKGPKSDLFNSTYSRGSSGDNVSHIQLRLYALGYLSKASSVDGDYGTNTYNAAGLFQYYNGLSATGAVDSATLKKLYSTGAVKLPSGQKAGDEMNSPERQAGDQQNNSTEISDGLKSTTKSPGSSDESKLEYVIYIAQNQLGKPYVYGANGTSSYDCTGFTRYCFKQIGITLQRSAIDQGYDNTYAKITSVSSLRRGDLVFFDTIVDGDESDHAGIYLGAGFFIHASSGQKKVVISTLLSGYYNRVFSWGRRVLAG